MEPGVSLGMAASPLAQDLWGVLLSSLLQTCPLCHSVLFDTTLDL